MDVGRVSVSIPVEVVDGTGSVVMSALVEWFISLKIQGHASQ